MNITCNLVKDLAELYHENLVSPETADAIRTHLKTCTSCRNHYGECAAMRKRYASVLPEGLPQDMAVTEQKLCENLSRKLRRRRFWRIVCSSAVIGAGSVMLTIGLFLTLNKEAES